MTFLDPLHRFSEALETCLQGSSGIENRNFGTGGGSAGYRLFAWPRHCNIVARRMRSNRHGPDKLPVTFSTHPG